MSESQPLVGDRAVNYEEKSTNTRYVHIISVTLLTAVVGAALAVIIHFMLQSPSNGVHADFIVVNATIYTAEDIHVNSTFSAMVVSTAGTILAVGSAPALAAQYGNVRQVDAMGKFIYPGFTDSHAHLLMLGNTLGQADLVGSTSPEEVVQRLIPFANNTNTTGGWIIARGWDQNLFPTKQYPVRQDLDGAFPNTPVWLRRVDGHAAWANSETLRLAGPLPDSDPPGGQIIRDEHGVPTGVFIDNAMNLIDAVEPPISAEQRYHSLQLAYQQCVKYGLTCIHDAGSDEATIDTFLSTADKGEIPIRVNVMTFDNPNSTEPIDYWCSRGTIPNYKDRIFVISAKMFVDGALGSRGAALLAPYSDDPNSTGLLVTEPDVLADHATGWMSCGFQVCTHSIGDRGNRVSLDAYTTAFQRLGIVDPDLQAAKRLRIEHAQIVTPEDRQRFKNMGVIASMQPTHATSDMGFAEDRLGPVRILNAYTWNTFRAEGVRLALGSDFPVELVNPLLGFYAAITRQDVNGNPPGGWYPKECLTRYETLQGFTLHAAYAAFQEHKLGSLAPGKFADFIILDQDIMQIPAIEIPHVKVLNTYVNGKVVYTADPNE